MDPALGGIFDAPSTAHSSGAASSVEATSANTAEFGTGDGRASSPSTAPQRGRYQRYREMMTASYDAAAAGPSSLSPLGNGDMIAAPATSISPVAERGRSRRSERSSRSTSVKVTTTIDSTLKSKSRTPRSSLSPRVPRVLTADEELDIAMKETTFRAGRAKTPERIPVMDQPHLLASPDPLMQPQEPRLQMVAPIQMTIDPVDKPASVKSVDSDLMRDLENSLMSGSRPAPNGEEAGSSGRPAPKGEAAGDSDYDRQVKR